MSETIKKKGLSISLACLEHNEKHLGDTQDSKNLIQSNGDSNSRLRLVSISRAMMNNKIRSRNDNRLQDNAYLKEKLTQVIRQKPRERHGSQRILIGSQNRRQIISLGKNSSMSLTSNKIQQGTCTFPIQARKSLPFFRIQQITHKVQRRSFRNDQIVYYRIQVSGQNHKLKQKQKEKKQTDRTIDKQNNEPKIKIRDTEDNKDKGNDKDKDIFLKMGDELLKRKLGYSKQKLLSDLSLIPDFHIRKQLKGINTNKTQAPQSEPVKKSQNKKQKQKASELEIEKLLEIQKKIEGLIVKSLK